jgi:hypothetical protein
MAKLHGIITSVVFIKRLRNNTNSIIRMILKKMPLKNITFIFHILALLFWVLLSGCATRPQGLPIEHYTALPWGTVNLDPSSMTGKYNMYHSVEKVVEKRMLLLAENKPISDINILILSGGGSGGAFGAGLLNGWKAQGTLPEFDIVTSISTGAIMASFAFIGGERIIQLENIFRHLTSSDLYTQSWFRIFNGATLNDATPLKTLLKNGIDEQFLAEIAREYNKGRRLYIGTTNIDTGQLVVWDMGAIAASNHPDKLQHYRDIIYASCAAPILFPPQFFEVEIEGKVYAQMHVDGGVYANAFLADLSISWVNALQNKLKQFKPFSTNLFLIANRKYRVRHHYNATPLKTLPILESYLEIQSDLLFDRSVQRIYQRSQTNGINFNMATIPKYSDHIKSMIDFVPSEMRGIYDIAYKNALTGYPWKTQIRWNEYDLQSSK